MLKFTVAFGHNLFFGLVDTLIYKNDVRNYLKAMVGIDKDDRMPVLGLQDMINAVSYTHL